MRASDAAGPAPAGNEGGWRRERASRVVAGVCGVLARRLGGSVRLWRALFLGGAALGAALVLGSAIFDAAFAGGPAGAAPRAVAAGAGLLLCFAYGLLALFLPDERRPRTWDFASAATLVLLLLLVAQALGVLAQPYWLSAKASWQQRGPVGWLTFPRDHVREHGFGLQDVVLCCFFLSAGGFLWTQRGALRRFFRSMYVGVTLVVLTLAAVAVGVLVPQIDGFEDPLQRVDLAKERQDYEQFRRFGYQKLPAAMQDGNEQYQAFRWAEGYFVYHLLHLYGIGMPSAEIPPQAAAGLDSFGRKYGVEERDNRSKQMKAAFQGQAKVQEIGQLIHDHEDAFWRAFEVATLLDLNRTYKSSWFAGLLALLGVAVAFNTFKGGLRSSLSLNKVGFVIVHAGVLVLLAGGLVSKLLTDRGLLPLYLGEPPSDTYLRHFDPTKLARMPFHVRLDRFARRDWPALEVYFADEHFSSRVPRYTLWPGRTIELDFAEDEQGRLRPRLALRVLALHDRAHVGMPFVSATDTGQESWGPVAELEVGGLRDPAQEGDRRVLMPAYDRVRFPHAGPDGAYRLGAVFGADGESAFPRGDDRVATVGTLEASVRGVDAPDETVPVRLGEEVALASGYRLRFQAASADLRREYTSRDGSTDPRPLAAQPNGLAAVWVDVVPEDGRPSERRILLEDVDDVEHGRQREYAYPDLVLRLRWDDWVAPGPPRYVLRWGHGSAPELLSESGERWPVQAGEPLPLPGDHPLVPLQVLEEAWLTKNLVFPEAPARPDGWDEAFYATEPRGLVVEVVRFPGTPQEVSERVEMASTEAASSNLWSSGDGKVLLHFLENTEVLPFEWRSVLAVLERDAQGALREVPIGPESAREIRVNDYFKYKGYRFFQTDARADQPTYSGVGVVYDPGIPIVLAGMYTIIAGMVVAFLVRPLVLGWDKVART